MIDMFSNFFIVCESNTEINSVDQIFSKINAQIYAKGYEPAATSAFENCIVTKPIISRHAKIIRGIQMQRSIEPIYAGIQKLCRFDIQNDDCDDFEIESGVDQSNYGTHVSTTMSPLLHQCLCDVNEQPSFSSQKRGQIYYISVPLQLFFANSIMDGRKFTSLRGRYHFQLRFDGVKIKEFRLAVNAFQFSEEDHVAFVEREIEFLTEMQYKMFGASCEAGIFEKSWKLNRPYTVRYFLIQVRDSDSGERLVCNLKGYFKLGDDKTIFNIHTNQIAQNSVLKLQKYNPFLWVVPYCIKPPGLQPTGCRFLVSEMEISVYIECDLNNVDIDCWMTCYRVLGQNFPESATKTANSTNTIGFLCDFDFTNETVEPSEKQVFCRFPKNDDDLWQSNYVFNEQNQQEQQDQEY